MTSENAQQPTDEQSGAGCRLVLCTCPNDVEALSIAQRLVEERLSACVNILPRLRSIYRWQGKVEQAEEYLLLIKTTSARFAFLRTRIQELHSYDTPEIIALDITEGSEKYLTWLEAQVS